MSTLPISAEAVLERMNAMRITAELSLARVKSYLASDPQPLARVVAGYRALVANVGSRIIHAQALVIHARSKNPTDARLVALERRTVEMLTAWSAHARGYTQYERPATEAEKGGAIKVGAAPVVVIAIAVAGAVIAVSVTGIAWAVVHYKEAQTLADEIALLERDPSLADAIAKINESSPSSTPPVDPTNPGGGWGWLLAALGLAGAAIFVVPRLGKG
ncbi:MAG: hypothetical protein Q8P41_29960 [Pseudomonadota bacterium]|nr:hypothetical protein [Pseudomonadota bacterium]MDP2317151.1 hypothetical protein [Pseudomonadota bacterium]